jgi:hypothetical protein
METELKQWIINKRDTGVCISGSLIQKTAIDIYNNIHPMRQSDDFEKKMFHGTN